MYLTYVFRASIEERPPATTETVHLNLGLKSEGGVKLVASQPCNGDTNVEHLPTAPKRFTERPTFEYEDEEPSKLIPFAPLVISKETDLLSFNFSAGPTLYVQKRLAYSLYCG